MTEVFENLEEGDKILFNDRKTPLEVEKVGEDRIVVAGPNGGEYEIYRAEDTDDLLISRKGNRRYSSYCKDLKEVGEWKREKDTWTHSKSSKQVKLEEMETGYWTLETDLDIEPDLPLYGFSRKEFAEEAAGKLVGNYPEGKT